MRRGSKRGVVFYYVLVSVVAGCPLQKECLWMRNASGRFAKFTFFEKVF